MRRGPSEKGLCVFLILIFVFFDQLIKNLLIKFPKGQPIIIVFPKFFKIQTLVNKGIAFGLFATSPHIFLWLNLIIIIYLFIFFFRTQKQRLYFPLALILAGALSNLIDRFFLGGVLDYLDLSFWPTFNLADIYITFGIVLILGDAFFKKKRV